MIKLADMNAHVYVLEPPREPPTWPDFTRYIYKMRIQNIKVLKIEGNIHDFHQTVKIIHEKHM